MFEEFFFTCDVCGVEEAEESAKEKHWLSLAKLEAFEVLICPECTASEEKLTSAFEQFATQLANDEQETLTPQL